MTKTSFLWPRSFWAGSFWPGLLCLPLAALPCAPASAQLPPPGSPIPRMEVPAAPSLSRPADLSVPAQPAAAPGVVLNVARVVVDGVTVYPQAQIEALCANLTGPAVALQHIEDARLAVLRRYRNDGYPLVAVDTRLDRNGTLTFAVAEGHIADVKLDGDIGPVGNLVLGFLDHLKQERPVRIASLERWILLAQDIPGLTVQTVLQPSQTEPGALTLVAKVERKPFSASFSADNRAYKYSGPDEGLLTVAANSFTALGEQTQVSLYDTLFNSEQLFGQASSEFYLGNSGLKMRIYGGAGNTAPGGQLSVVNYSGTTTIFGAQLSYPIIKRRAQELTALAIFDAVDSDVTQTAAGSEDSVRTFRGGLDYALRDEVFGGARSGLNTVSLRVSTGIPALGASANDRPNAGRIGEQFDFLKANLEITRDQMLVHLTENDSISLYGAAFGQVANAVLPSAEEFLLGGLRYNRGYYSGEVTGDNGLSTTVELRLNGQHAVNVLGNPVDLGSQLYGFWDWGEVWQNQSSDANQNLSSVGAGIRLFPTRYAELDLEGVHRNIRELGAGVAPLSSNGVYWRVVLRY